MIHANLFSGIGGWEIAADAMGWETVFQCEKEPFCQRILKYYWPNAYLFDNVETADFTPYAGKVDCLTMSPPCQPFSHAGHRAGTEDPRHLWPHGFRAVREIKPRWVVFENVRGFASWSEGLVFEQVCADLEGESYEVVPFILPAAGVNAPHRRDRVFIIAYSKSQRLGKEGADVVASEQWDTRIGDKRYVTHSGGEGLAQYGSLRNDIEQEQPSVERGDRQSPIDAERSGLPRIDRVGKSVRPKPGSWDPWPTVESLFCPGDDGLSSRLDGITISKWRNESIKGAGNAVVPQVILQIFKTIEAYDKKTNY
jgi:DNA (cytosine-5)-methyltransferase 1